MAEERGRRKEGGEWSFTSINGKLKYGTWLYTILVRDRDRDGFRTRIKIWWGKRAAFFLEVAFVVMGNLSSVRSLDRGMIWEHGDLRRGWTEANEALGHRQL